MPQRMRQGLGGALVGLLVGVLGSEVVRGSGARLVSQGLNYGTTILEDAVKRRQQSGRELAPQASQGRPDVDRLPSHVQHIVRLAEQLAPKPIEVTRGSIANSEVKLVSFVQKAGGSGSHEFIELEALRPLDLSQGLVGDSKRQPTAAGALRLPPELRMKPGDRLRIFTTEDPTPTRIVELHNRKGIWKGDSGENDSVWVATSEGRKVLDFSYKVW